MSFDWTKSWDLNSIMKHISCAEVPKGELSCLVKGLADSPDLESAVDKDLAREWFLMFAISQDHTPGYGGRKIHPPTDLHDDLREPFERILNAGMIVPGVFPWHWQVSPGGYMALHPNTKKISASVYA